MIPLKPSLDELRALSAQGNLIPVYTELAADYETPVSVFQKLQDGGPCFLLESAERSEQVGRYSFIGFQPRLEIRARGREITIKTEAGTSTRTLAPEEGDPLHELERLMRPYRPVKVEGLPLFVGGAVGYLAYDMVRFFEPTVTAPPADALGLPDMVFLITDTFVVFDHRFRRMQVVTHVKTDEFATLEDGYAAAGERIGALVERLGHGVPVAPMPLLNEPPELEAASNTTRAEYEAMVAAAKEYIHAGDVFQVVLSQRFSAPYAGTPLDLYRALRHVNPSPYMFCLQLDDDFALVGSSPEVHVRVMEGEITIRPIAGTRWRGKTPQEDAALADELLADPKERAEHVMLVDLARNDVGRVAEYHSVKLTERMIIERYSHVMHIVSNVVGTLSPAHSAYDVMRATFPAGTVSGSPKVRAMQIIHELEKSKRCAYAGAVGYFGFDGNHDSCIALRTAVLKDGVAHAQAGAGIVADSDPGAEYQETVNKARATLRAIARAQHYTSEAPAKG